MSSAGTPGADGEGNSSMRPHANTRTHVPAVGGPNPPAPDDLAHRLDDLRPQGKAVL